MGANELSAQLWRERELLEALLFKLEEEQLLLRSGATRWISRATLEVEQVIERMRTIGLARTVEVSAVADEWGTSPDATLRELVAAAPEGVWSDIFASHLEAMLELTREIETVRDVNAVLLRDAAASTEHDIAFQSNSARDEAEAAIEDLDLAARAVNLSTASAATARALHPAVIDFLS